MATTETARIPEDITGRARRVPVGEVNWRTTFRALRHRNYRLFFYGQLVSLIGTWLQQTAMSWFVYEITGSKFLLGAVSAVGSAPMMIFSLWGGSLADRYPKRSILIGTQAAQMFCAFVLAAGAHLGFANANFIIVIAALNGIAMGFDIPARQAFTVEMTSREDLLNAISLNSSIFHAARVIGPSIAGLMIGTVGIAICFFLNGLSFIAVIAGLLMMKLPPQLRPVTHASPLEHAWKGIVYSVTSARAHDSPALFCGWRFRLVLHGADARIRARRTRPRSQRLRNSDFSERRGRTNRRADRGCLRTPGHAAQTCLQRCLFVLRRDDCIRLGQKFLSGYGFPIPCRIRNASIFRHFEYNVANYRAGRNARPRDGCLVARLRRDDSSGQSGSRSRRAFLGNAVRARLWRNHLSGRGDHYSNFDCASRSGSGNLEKLRHSTAQTRMIASQSFCLQLTIHDMQGAFLHRHRGLFDRFA